MTQNKWRAKVVFRYRYKDKKCHQGRKVRSLSLMAFCLCYFLDKWESSFFILFCSHFITIIKTIRLSISGTMQRNDVPLFSIIES